MLMQLPCHDCKCIRHMPPLDSLPKPALLTISSRLAAQLARTEEAAKRALVRLDQGARGSTAQQLLDAQRQIQQLQAENSELSSKLARWTWLRLLALES
jgi:hypothetical protein